jgi:hypothetical protein
MPIAWAEQTSKHYWFIKTRSVGGKLSAAMFSLDYLICFLTILAIILAGRKSGSSLALVKVHAACLLE